MRKRITMLVSFALLVLPVAGHGEVQNVHQHSTAPADTRYEIVQSEIAARWTFRLDRFTGEISQLVLTADDEDAWETMQIEELPRVRTNKPRFQIFTSGLAARHTFLIDTISGRTWTLTTQRSITGAGKPLEVTCWKPFKSLAR